MNLFGSKPNIKQVAWYVNASYYTVAHAQGTRPVWVR